VRRIEAQEVGLKVEHQSFRLQQGCGSWSRDHIFRTNQTFGCIRMDVEEVVFVFKDSCDS
jgi:hypothetical protein